MQSSASADSIRLTPAAWLVSVFAFLQACQLFAPTLIRQDLYENDASQHIWWMYQFQDRELFPNDPAAAYFGRLIDPPGYKLLFRVFAPFIDAQIFSELLPWVLSVPMVVLAFLVSRRAARQVVPGAIAGCAFLIYISMHSLRGGFPRSFALPILLLAVWAASSRRLVWLGIAFLAAASFFPPMLVTIGLFALTVLGVRLVREKKLPRGWVACALLTASAAVIAISVYGRPLPADIGRPPTRREAQAMPEYQPGGRIKFFVDDWRKYYFGSKPSAVGVGLGASLVLVLLLALTVAAFPHAVPFEAWALLGTSLFAFALAHGLLFRLYFPNRYTIYSLPVFGMLWLSSLVGHVGGDSSDARAAKWLAVLQSLRARHAGAWLACAAIVLLAIQAGQSLKKRAAAPPSWSPGRGGEEVAAFLRTLPKDVLVAAHPDDADHIPLRARRSVLASTEMSVPLHTEFYRRQAQRTEAELEACYASDWGAVDAIRDRYGASVFVVNQMRYSDEASIEYLEPFREGNRRRFAAGRAKGFVLQDPPADRVLFRAGDMTVVRVGQH